MNSPEKRLSSFVVRRLRGRACVLAGGVLLLAAAIESSSAQTPASDGAQDQAPAATATLSVTAKLVAIDAVVRRKDTGDPVMDLDKDAFTLKEDGKPVTVRYFNHDNDLPLTVGLMVDTSGSQRTFFDDEEMAGDNFLRNTLRQPGDRAFIVRFDSQVLLLQKMTSNLQLLHNGLRLLDYTRDPGHLAAGKGGTLLFDSIATVSSNVIGKEQGRRALVILTDGDDNGSRTDMNGAIRKAQLADVAIYSVLYTDEVFSNGMRYPSSGGRMSGIDVMTEISRATGGRAFIVGAKTPVKEIFAAVAEDLRTQYRLGFTPGPSKPGQMHKLELKTSDRNLNVQARTAYVTPEQ